MQFLRGVGSERAGSSAVAGPGFGGQAASLLTNLEVDAQQMRYNLDLLQGVVYSQSALLALVENGMSRDDAYRIVQQLSRKALDTHTHLRDVLVESLDVNLTHEQLRFIFDESRVLEHASKTIDAL